MLLTQIVSSLVDKGKRIIKLMRMSDCVEVSESMPFGVDSQPLPNMIAIYSQTKVKGANVVLGYINVNQLVDIGETRLFSADKNNTIKYNVKLSNDSNLYLGVSTDFITYADNLVKANETIADLQAMITQMNTNLTLIATGMNAIMPDSYVPQPVIQDFTNIIATNIKIE